MFAFIFALLLGTAQAGACDDFLSIGEWRDVATTSDYLVDTNDVFIALNLYETPNHMLDDAYVVDGISGVCRIEDDGTLIARVFNIDLESGTAVLRERGTMVNVPILEWSE